jgi:hypothetical protein
MDSWSARPIGLRSAGADPLDAVRGSNMRRKIVGYHRDGQSDWVAELECGHPQHVRHRPPWEERPWTLSAEGRASRIGSELTCKRCQEEGREQSTGGSEGPTP